MSSQQEFFTAHVPEPQILLGVQLRPFSLGHLVLLHRLGSAYATGGTPDISDLVSSVFTCSQTYAEAEAVLTTGKVPVKQKGWFGSKLVDMPLPDAMALWQEQIGPFDFTEKSSEFAAYTKAGSKHPLVSSVRGSDGGNSVNDCPFVQQVKVVLMSKLNFREADLLDRPWSLCLWDYCTSHMLEGNLHILNRDEFSNARAVADSIHERIQKGELRYGT